MKESNVFLLIKSMLITEKRYFSVFSQRHILGSQNKYIILFNALNSQEKEDDTLLKKELKKYGYDSEYLAADKNYLYNQILKCFQVYHSQKTTTIFQTGKLVLIEILYEKGLYHLCIKEIEKALKTDLKVENFSLIIELLTWKRKAVGYTKGLKAAYEVNTLIDFYLAKMQNQIVYTNLYYESLRLRFMNFKARSQAVVKEFEKLLSHPLLGSEIKTDSLLAKIRFHLIYSNYFFVINDKKRESEHLYQLILLMESSEYYAAENPFDYLYVYYYWLESVRKETPEQFGHYIEKLRAFSDKVVISKKKVSLQINLFSGLAIMDNLLDNNAYQKAYALIPEMRNEQTLSSQYIEPAWIIKQYFLFAKAAIAMGKYTEALEYLNFIFNEHEEHQRVDYYNYSRILFMVVHFSLKNYSLIEYIYVNTFSYFKKRNKLYRAEKVVLDFFKDVSLDYDDKNIHSQIQVLYKKLEIIQKESYETPLFELFDLTLWVKSVIENTQMYRLI